MSLSNALENQILDHILGGPDYSRVATVYFGLSTTTPNEDGSNFTEPAVGSYARVAVTNNLTNFPAASAGSKSNGIVITFPQATANWAASPTQITHFGIFTAVSGGTPIMTGALTAAREVLTGDTPRFGVGTFVINAD